VTEHWSAEEIRAHWTAQATAYGAAPTASWSDLRVMEREVREISQRLPATGTVLDVGCANGWSTLQFAAERAIHVKGVDYIPEMIDSACEQLATVSDRLCGTAEFAVADARDLVDEPALHYDAVVCIRVIINLGDWREQERGLRECVRVVKPGGLFLLSEATLQGWRRLNALRAEWGLDSIPMPSFNNYLDEDAVIEALDGDARLEEIVNFASTYFVATRVLKPLLQAATAAPVDPADPLSEWNRWAAELPAWGDYGTQKLFVFRRSE
jgi:SAM-dependent methyltransferase